MKIQFPCAECKIFVFIYKLVLECITVKSLLRLKRLPSKGRLSIIQTSTYSWQTVLLFEGGGDGLKSLEECRLCWPSGTLLTHESPVVSVCTTTFNIRVSAFCPTQCICVFCIALWTSSDYLPIQNCLIRFYSLEEMCLLCCTNRVFKCS